MSQNGKADIIALHSFNVKFLQPNKAKGADEHLDHVTEFQFIIVKGIHATDQFPQIWTLAGHSKKSVGDIFHLMFAIHWQIAQGQAENLVVQQQLEELANLGCLIITAHVNDLLRNQRRPQAFGCE